MYEMAVSENFMGSFAEFRTSFAKIAPSRQAKIDAFQSANRKEDMVSVKKASKHVGILCLSKPGDDCLMWAHYAQQHSGVAFGFKLEEICKGSAHDGKVRYQASRTKFEHYKILSHAWWRAIERILCTKSLQWGYEKEHRNVFPLKRLEKIGNNFFTRFYPGSLKEVRLGFQMRSWHEIRIRQLLKAKEFTHVKIFKMERHTTRFVLRAVESPNQ
jgi:hypothetical protein